MFAAAIGISPTQADLIQDVPFWLFHGDADPIVSVNFSRNFVARLQDAGESPLDTEIAGGRHNVWNQVHGDAYPETPASTTGCFRKHLRPRSPNPAPERRCA